MKRILRKGIAINLLNRCRKRISIPKIAKELGYSSNMLYAWRNNPHAAPSEEQLEDLMEWSRDWWLRHKNKQASPMIRRPKANET